MYEVSETLDHLGLEPLTALAPAKRLDWLAALKLSDAAEAPDMRADRPWEDGQEILAIQSQQIDYSIRCQAPISPPVCAPNAAIASASSA